MSPLLRRILSASLCGMISIPAFAQPPSPDKLLDDAKKQQEIVTQRAEADLRATLQQAAKVSPAEAIGKLKAALERIQINDQIATTRKEAMVRMLKDRIRITEQAAKTATTKPSTDDEAKIARTNARLAELDKQKAEREKIRTAINNINQLVGQGNTKEAERKAKELADQYPDNPAAKAMGRNGFINARIRESKDLLTEQERRWTMASRDMDKSSMPITGDVEFDKKRWAEITKMRKGEQLSEKELAILKSLNEPVKAQWRGSALRDVIEYLATVSGQTLFIDRRALEDLNLTEETAVSFFAPREVTMRTALRKILQDLNMTYVVKDQVIYITSQQRAKDMMVTRTYYVGDLTMTAPFGLGGVVNPLLLAQQEMESAKIIMEMIKEQVDPSSWAGGGGAGTITYSSINKAFIIRQSAEVHSLLKGGVLR